MADPDTLPTGLAMPAFDWKLNDQEIADVLTYIRNSWGNRAPAVSADTVADMRESAHKYGPRYQRLLSRH
jgi:mono/diheme cytochrome c family protein